MAKVVVTPAETKVVEVKPEKIVVELSRLQAEIVLSLVGHAIGDNEYEDDTENLYDALMSAGITERLEISANKSGFCPTLSISEEE